jgi:hypothetical protein
VLQLVTIVQTSSCEAEVSVVTDAISATSTFDWGSWMLNLQPNLFDCAAHLSSQSAGWC